MPMKYKLFKSPVDDRDIMHDAVQSSAILPSHMDLSEYMPPVLDQGELGSCASNATSNILRHLLKKEGKTEFQPSRLYIYFNTRVNVEHSPVDEDTGVCIRDVCKALSKYHACSETVWPYIISRFSIAPTLEAFKNAELNKKVKYAYVPQDLESIKKCIYAKHPIIIGIQVYESLESQTTMETGVIPMPDVQNEKCLGGHAIALTGYSDETKRFTIQNSWGTSVGLPDKRGFFTIPYEYVLDANLAQDFWVISLFD